MRKCVLVAALAPMASCIGVEDYGTAWDRAALDKTLAGSWKEIASRPDQTRAHGYGIGVVSTFVEKGGAYQVTTFDTEGKSTRPGTVVPTDRPMYPIKTISIGPYRFVATPAPHGFLDRYVVRGNALEMCMAIGPAQVDFQKKEYPSAVNIGKNHSEGSFLEIRRWDDEVEKVIAAIPDTPDYWDCDWKYVRVSSPTGR
jgi:hypothetical protein